MADRLKQWDQRVRTTMLFLEGETPERQYLVTLAGGRVEISEVGGAAPTRTRGGGGGETGASAEAAVLGGGNAGGSAAELRHGQKDSDSLPPYEVLDPILEAFIEEDLSVDQIAARGFDRATVGRILDLVKRNEYKRRQAPPGVRVSGRAFGRDWRYPITSGYKSR